MKIKIIIEFDNKEYREQREVSQKEMNLLTLNLADVIKITINEMLNKLIPNILKQNINREKDKAN